MVKIHFIMRRSEFYSCIITRQAPEERVGLVLTSFASLHPKLILLDLTKGKEKENKEVY